MICLSFDTDHVRPEYMQQFLQQTNIPGQATFFLDRPYPNFDWGLHEVGPHPFVENLATFEKDFMEYTKSLKINSQGVRAHSCVFSQVMAVQLKNQGYQYISTTTPTGEKGLKPYRYSWGLWEMPIYYMDNMDMCMKVNWPELGHKPFDHNLIQQALDDPEGLYIFDFHPLHIMLNTTSFEAYQEIKSKIIQDGVNPLDLKMPGYGVENFFIEVCQAIKDTNKESMRLSAALNTHIKKTSQESSYA